MDSNTSPISIILIEDNLEYREVIRFSFKNNSEIELVQSFGSAESALSYLQHLTANLHPEAILLDLNLPGLSGVEAIPEILNVCPDSKIVILTQSNQENDIVRAIANGADGYLLKSASIQEIVRGIQASVSGDVSLDPTVARVILDLWVPRIPKDNQDRELSKRELEILKLVSEGFVKKEIADKLGIGVTTVAYHIKHIYEKLNVPNAPAAISKAYRTGVL